MSRNTAVKDLDESGSDWGKILNKFSNDTIRITMET